MKNIGLKEKEILWRKEEILLAAKTVFLKKGFYEATMDDIARETGLSKGALYLYFPSKERLVAELMEKSLEGYVHLTQEVLQAKEASAERIARYVGAAFDYFGKNADLIRMVMMLKGDIGCSCMQKNFHEKANEIMIQVNNNLSAIMKAGIKEKTFKDRDPEKMALALSGMVHEFLMKAIFTRTKKTLEEDKKTILEIFFEGVKK